MSVVAVHGYAGGRVQGVGFRRHARLRALQLGLCGWVRNCPDGRVEYFLEGEDQALQSMLAWLRSGPAAARVDSLSQLDCPVKGLTDFQVHEDAPSGQ